MRPALIRWCDSAPNGIELIQHFDTPASGVSFLLTPFAPLYNGLTLLSDAREFVISERRFNNLIFFLENSSLNPVIQSMNSLPFFFAHKLMSNSVISALSYFVNSNRSRYASVNKLKSLATFLEPVSSYFISIACLHFLQEFSNNLISRAPNSGVYLGQHGSLAIENEAFYLAFSGILSETIHAVQTKGMRALSIYTGRHFNDPNFKPFKKKPNKREKQSNKHYNTVVKDLKKTVESSMFWGNLSKNLVMFKRGELLRNCTQYKEVLSLVAWKLLAVQGLLLISLYSNYSEPKAENGVNIICQKNDGEYSVYLFNSLSIFNFPILGNFLAFSVANLCYTLMSLIADMVTSVFYKKKEDSEYNLRFNISPLSLISVYNSLSELLSSNGISTKVESTAPVEPRQSYPLSEEQASTNLSEPNYSLKRRKKDKEKTSSSSDEDSPPPSPSSSSSYTQPSISTGIKFQIAHLDYREFFHIESLSTGNMMAFGIVINKDARIANQYVKALENCTPRTVIRISEDGYASKLYRTKNSDDRLLGYSGKTALSQLEKFTFNGVSINDSLHELTEFAERYGKKNIEIHTFNDVYSHSK